MRVLGGGAARCSRNCLATNLAHRLLSDVLSLLSDVDLPDQVVIVREYVYGASLASCVAEAGYMGEVAAARGISRQGVHDLVRRCNKTLEEYEEKLHLVQRFVQIRENVNEIRKLTDPSGDTPKEDVMQRIAAIASDILEEL